MNVKQVPAGVYLLRVRDAGGGEGIYAEDREKMRKPNRAKELKT